MKPLTDSMDFEVDEQTFCWIVTGKKTSQGYKPICRCINHQPTTFYAHRVAYEIAHGPLEPGQLVAHTCDNPSCINPDHLFAGSQRLNAIDMARKDRGVAYLTKEQATEILLRPYWAHGDITRVAAEYGVHHTVVGRVLSPNGWIWLKEDLGMNVKYRPQTAEQRAKAREYQSTQYRLKHGPRKPPAILTLYYKKLRNKQYDQISPEEREAACLAVKEYRQRQVEKHIENGTIDQYRKAASVRSMKQYRSSRQNPETHRKLLDRINERNRNLEHTNPELRAKRLKTQIEKYRSQRDDPVTGQQFMKDRREQQKAATARRLAKQQEQQDGQL